MPLELTNLLQNKPERSDTELPAKTERVQAGPAISTLRNLQLQTDEYQLDIAQQIDAEKAALRGGAAGYLGLGKDAFLHESFLGGALKGTLKELTAPDMLIDPEFSINQALPNALLKTYPEELHNYLLDATSAEDLDYRRWEVDTVKEYQERLHAWGLGGMPALILGSALGDPSTYLSGVVSAASKGKEALTAGQTLVAAGAAAGLDLSSAVAVQEHLGFDDITAGVVGSMAVTTGILSLGKLSKGSMALAEATQKAADSFHATKSKRIFRDRAIEQGIIPKPTTASADDWVDKWVDDVFEYHKKNNQLIYAEKELAKIDEALAQTVEGTPQAALLRTVREQHLPGVETLRKDLEGRVQPTYEIGGEAKQLSISGTLNLTADEAALWKESQKLARGLRPYVDKLSKSMAGQVLNSANDVAMSLMYRLGEYAPGWGGKFSRGKTAAGWRELHDRQFMSLWAGDFQTAEKQYFKATKTGLMDTFQRHARQTEFNLAVQRELNARRFDREGSILGKFHAGDLTATEKAIKQAADALARVRNDLLFTAKSEGVERFINAGWREYTTARKWLPSNFYRMAQDPNMGWAGIEEMLHLAIQKALKSNLKGGLAAAPKDVPEKLSRAWAAAIVRRNKQGLANTQGFTNDLFSIEDRSFIDRLLSEVGLDETNKETFIRAVDKARAERTSQEVIEMDLNTKFRDHDIWELLDPNVPANMVREVKRVSGEIALAKVGIKSDKDFNDLMKSVTNYGLSRGLSADDVAKDVKYLDATRKLLLGETLESDPSGGFAKGSQLLRDMVQLGTLNYAGFAQLSETGRVAARLGVSGMLRSIPILKTLRRDLQTGKLKNTWLADLEDAGYGWIGNDHILNNPQYRIDANNFGVEATWDSESMAKFSGLVKRMKHVQGFINGMNSIKTMQDRILTQGVASKIAGLIGKESIPEGQLKRLIDIGIDEKMLPRIRKQMQAQDWETNKSFGLSKWTDQEAADTVMLAIQRAWTQDIQRSLVGEQYLWTHSTLGKLFAQFRTFTLGAIEKQSMHALKMRDLEALMTATWGMAFGTAAYMARVYTQALNKEDRDKFLEERMTTQAITSGGANLVGMSSILPELSHMVGYLTGQPEWDLFRYSMDRGTGLTRRGSGVSISSLAPSGAYVNRLFRILQNTTRAAVDDEFNLSRRDLEDMIKAFPLGDNVWMGLIYNTALEDIPETNYE